MAKVDTRIESDFHLEDLERLGLSSYEAKTYIEMLSLDFSSARDISDISKVPFGRMYDVLSKLEIKGLVEKQNSRPAKFRAERPKIAINKLISLKEKEVESIKNSASHIEEKLSKFYNSSKEESLFWSVAMDEETMVHHEEKLLESEDELLIYLHTPHGMNSTTDLEVKNFIDTIGFLSNVKKVKVKIIFGSLSKNDLSAEFLASYNGIKTKLMNIEVRYSDLITNTFDVIDSEKVIIKINNPINSNEYLAMIFLWQKAFAEKMKNKFYEIWNNSNVIS